MKTLTGNIVYGYVGDDGAGSIVNFTNYFPASLDIEDGQPPSVVEALIDHLRTGMVKVAHESLVQGLEAENRPTVIAELFTVLNFTWNIV